MGVNCRPSCQHWEASIDASIWHTLSHLVLSQSLVGPVIRRWGPIDTPIQRGGSGGPVGLSDLPKVLADKR